jgi:hypothetical protein
MMMFVFGAALLWLWLLWLWLLVSMADGKQSHVRVERRDGKVRSECVPWEEVDGG